MTALRSSIDKHPDLLALRVNYERAAESVAVQATLGITLLFGLYVAMSPWIVGFNASSRLGVIDLIAGIATAVLALGFSSVLDRTHGILWALPVIGVWVIVAPWVHTGAAPDASMMWSNVVSGVVIATLGTAATLLGMRARAEASAGESAPYRAEATR
jgi:SPW repeat